MLRFRVKSRPPKYIYEGWKQREAFVVLPVDALDVRAKYEVEGEAELVAEIRGILGSAYGLYGRSLEEMTTASDLHHAMFGPLMRAYAAELIEGAEIFERGGE